MKAPLLRARKPVSRLIDHQSEQGVVSKKPKSFLPPPVVLLSDPISAPLQKKENGAQQSFFADQANWHYFSQNQNKSTSKQNIDATQTKTSTGKPIVQGFFKSIGKAISSGAKAVVGGVKTVAGGVKNAASQVINGVANVANTAKNIGSNLFNTAGNIAGGLFNSAKDFVQQGLTFVTEKTAPVVSFIQNIGGPVWEFVKSAGSKAAGFVEGVGKLLQSGGSALLGVLQTYGSAVLNKLAEAGTGIWNTLKDIAQLGIESAGPVLDLILSGDASLIDILKGAGSGAKNFVLGLKDMMFSKGEAWLGSLLSLGKGVLTKLINASGSVLNRLFDIITNQAPWITEAVLNLISKGASFVNKLATIGGKALDFFNILKSLGQDIGKSILEKIFTYSQNKITEIIKLSSPVLNAFITMANKIGISAINAVQKLITYLIKRGGEINAIATEVINIVKNFISGNLKNIASAVEGKLKDTMEIAVSFLSNIIGIGKIKDTFGKIGNKVRSKVNSVGGSIKKGAKKAWKFLTGGAKSIAQGGKKVANKIGSKLNLVGSKVRKGVKSVVKRRNKRRSIIANFIDPKLNHVGSKVRKGVKSVVKRRNKRRSIIANFIGPKLNHVGSKVRKGVKNAVESRKKRRSKVTHVISQGPKTIGSKMKSVGSKIKSILKRRKKKLRFA